MKKFVLFLITLFSLVFESLQLYVHLHKGEEKCFYDEFYKDIVVMVRYKILDKDISLTTQSDKRLEIQIISEKDKKIIHKHESGKYTGKFSLTIEKTENYMICIYSNDADFFNKRKKIKVSLMIDTDQDEFDDSTISANSKNFKAVDTYVRKLFQKTADIIKVQEYEMTREDEFSENQFANNNKMIVITIIQVVIIFVIGIWQIFALRRVFKEKIWSPF